MFFLYGILFVFLVGIGIYANLVDRTNQVFWSEQSCQEQQEKARFWEKAGLFLYEKVHKVQICLDGGRERDEKEQEKYRAVYIGKDDRFFRKREQAKIWGYIWLLAGCVSFIGMILCLSMSDNTLIDGNKLERPSFGEGEVDYEITVSGIGNETENITITVGEQQPGEQEMNVVFESALEEVKQEVLGENVSLEEVRTDLNFLTMTDKGIRLSWESGDETALTSFGEIVAEEIPADGIIVPITVYMTYATYEAWYEFYVRILPPIKDVTYYKNELPRILQTAVEENVQSQYASLPIQIEQYDLSYSVNRANGGFYIGVLGFVAILLLSILSGKNIEKQYEARNAQMIDDYSQIISQLSVLTTCGMNLRSAWGRVVRDYEKRKAFRKTEQKEMFRYAYEEMRRTNYELERGVPESRAYATFGKRCGIYRYVKFGNLLEQSVRQGSGGLEEALNREATEALENKIHEAKRKGEQAETKMLIPMFLMLGIVMAVLMIPAFLSF